MVRTENYLREQVGVDNPKSSRCTVIMEEVKYSKQSNCVHHYHVVIVTKYRKKIFNAGVYGFLKAID